MYIKYKFSYVSIITFPFGGNTLSNIFDNFFYSLVKEYVCHWMVLINHGKQ